jgi:site-specific DNA-methyltransferase (adenine-specific)
VRRPAAVRANSPFRAWPLPKKGTAITLWQVDAVRGLRENVQPHGVDVIVTSPPYNLGVRYSTYHDRRPREEYLAWIGTVAAAVERALADDGSFFLNVAGPPSDPWLPWDVARQVGEHLRLQNVLHWVKSIVIEKAHVGRAAGLDRDLAVGHYKPLHSERFVHGAHEYVFHFSHRGDVRIDRLAIGVAYQDRSNVGRWNGARGGRRCRGNTWFLPYATIQRRASDRPHPASFPPELAERCLRLHGLSRIDLAADPFVGIGSSATAAAQLGLPFVGFDIDAAYLAVAARRLDAQLGGTTPRGTSSAGPSRTASSRSRSRSSRRAGRRTGRTRPSYSSRPS